MKLSTHKTKAEAKAAAAIARKTRQSVIVSSQPEGYVVYGGQRLGSKIPLKRQYVVFAGKAKKAPARKKRPPARRRRSKRSKR